MNRKFQDHASSRGKRELILILLTVFSLYFFMGHSFAQEKKTTPTAANVQTSDVTVSSNPFHIETGRLVPGSTFAVYLDDQTVKNRLKSIYLQLYNKNKIPVKDKRLYLKAFIKDTGTLGELKTEIIIYLPGWKDELKKFLNPSLFHGIFHSHTAELIIADNQKEKEGETNSIIGSFHVEISEPFWAWFWAVIAVFGSVLIGGLIKKRIPGFKLWECPFYFATTPRNRYSLSLTQVIIWTYVMIFGIVFVWIMTQRFMEITPQVLLLLGIGGGTAALNKIQTSSRLQNIPIRFKKIIEEKRKPSLTDLITSDGDPSIIKFQMLAFTGIIAVIVFLEIINNYKFPNLSEGLVTLMGVSSAVFIGNDLNKTVKVEDLGKKFDEIDNYVNPQNKATSTVTLEDLVMQNDPKAIQLKNELKDIVDAYLS